MQVNTSNRKSSYRLALAVHILKTAIKMVTRAVIYTSFIMKMIKSAYATGDKKSAPAILAQKKHFAQILSKYG